MCGIAGYCLKQEIVSHGVWEKMFEAIRKRGPDDEGMCLVSRAANQHRSYKTRHTVAPLAATLPSPDAESARMAHDIALLHTRYAIIDLSQQGHQPFVSANGRVVAIFNGEIYNYIELRQELQALGVTFRTESDTEVLVEGYVQWGEGLWTRMNGFWAVALYNHATRALTLSRDRMGVAPLYYRQASDGLYFASYIQPLLDAIAEPATVNDDVLRGFIDTGFKDLDNTTYYNEIHSVPAGTTVYLESSQTDITEARRHRYWTLPESRLSIHDISFSEAVTKFRALLFDAVELRLRADVKVAFELSGGLDSSSVVAAAAELRAGKISTYTAKIRYADEEPFARAMRQRYPVEYHVFEGMEDDFAGDFADFSRLMEEPYDNPNAYTHYRMLQTMKRDGVQVVVTGAGGDEVLAGYEGSFWPKAYREWRSQGGAALWQADWYEFRRRFKSGSHARRTLAHYACDPWRYAKRAVGSGRTQTVPRAGTTASRYQQEYHGLSFSEQRRFHFEKALLPYYMRSSDHFTMGIPVEHRFPLLDYRIVEFGLQLPVNYLFRNGWTKYILRKAMEPYLPREIVWRRTKMGFTFPYQSFFTRHRETFRQVYERYVGAFGDGGYGSYEVLLNTEPVLLWRLLSTAIWRNERIANGRAS